MGNHEFFFLVDENESHDLQRREVIKALNNLKSQIDNEVDGINVSSIDQLVDELYDELRNNKSHSQQTR